MYYMYYIYISYYIYKLYITYIYICIYIHFQNLVYSKTFLRLSISKLCNRTISNLNKPRNTKEQLKVEKSNKYKTKLN